MNATLVVCALALGGWAMPDQADPTPPLYEDLSTAPAATPRYAVERREGDVTRTPSPTLEDGNANTPRSSFPQRSASQWPGRTLGSGTVQGQTGLMPAEPTNSTTGNLVPGMPLQPTAQAGPGMNAPAGGGPLGVGGLGMPATPTAANPFTGPGNGAALAGGVAPMRPPANFGLTAQNAPVSDKPFANYKPSPTVSPWLNLYRNDTANGTQDNYTGIVRPMLEQQNANQHFAAQINTNASKLQQQQSALQRSGQDMPVGAGLVNPQYFINYGSYYKFPQMPTTP
jgi:hypothetical protein